MAHAEPYRFSAHTINMRAWVKAFHRYGFLILEDAIDPPMVQRLRSDLIKANNGGTHKRKAKGKKKKKGHTRRKHTVHKVFFERSQATVDLIEHSVLSDLAERIVQSGVPGGGAWGNSLAAHVFHNNAFTVPPQGRGQAPRWHMDDPPHNVLLPRGYVLPPEIQLPVLAMTYMIWLSDCPTANHGPTHVVPESHRFQRPPDDHPTNVVAATGPAGTAVLVNSQTWHRGAENQSSVPRDTLQISWGRRLVGHKHRGIIDYTMDPAVVKGRSDTLKRRLGYLHGGAYS